MHLLDINGTSKSITQKEFYCTKQWRTKQQIHDIVVYTTLTKHHTIIHLRTQPKTYSYRTHLIRYPRTHRWDTSHNRTQFFTFSCIATKKPNAYLYEFNIGEHTKQQTYFGTQLPILD